MRLCQTFCEAHPEIAIPGLSSPQKRHDRTVLPDSTPPEDSSLTLRPHSAFRTCCYCSSHTSYHRRHPLQDLQRAASPAFRWAVARDTLHSLMMNFTGLSTLITALPVCTHRVKACEITCVIAGDCRCDQALPDCHCESKLPLPVPRSHDIGTEQVL